MTNHKPCVSVGMPVYNGERFLKEALDSILVQTFEDFELIISDNASTDGTQEICQAYATQDQRIRYYRNEQNLGAAANYNRVFKLASGKYFKWASHDDLCAPEFLERCVEVLERKPSVVLCYPRTAVIDKHGKHVENLLDDLNLRSPKPHERYEYYHNRFRFDRRCNPVFGLIRSSVLEMTPLIGHYVLSDEVLVGELALRGEFYEVPQRLFFRRVHPQMSVRKYPIKKRTIWFDSTKGGQIQLPNWRWFLEQLASIWRVPIKWHEKIRCYSQMGRWALWNWKMLKYETIMAAKHVLRPLPKPIKLPIKYTLRYLWRLIKMIFRALRTPFNY